MFCIKVLVALITEICFVTFFLTAISAGRFSSWWVCPQCWRSCSVWSCGAWTNPGTSYPKTVLSWAPSVTQRDLLCCEECQHFTKIHPCLFLPLQLFLFELQLQHDSAELHVQVVGSLQFPLVMLTDVQSVPVKKKTKKTGCWCHCARAWQNPPSLQCARTLSTDFTHKGKHKGDPEQNQRQRESPSVWINTTHRIKPTSAPPCVGWWVPRPVGGYRSPRIWSSQSAVWLLLATRPDRKKRCLFTNAP